jgi:Flp pilus assembly secretin CpaC
MRRHIFLLSAALSLMGAGPAVAAGLSVPMDEARVVSFAKPLAQVFVANTTFADVRPIDSTHFYILGKAFGSTNLIGLNAQGDQVVSEHLLVVGSNHLVTLNRGSAQFTFACATSRCEVQPTPGDVRPWHDDNVSEVEKREDDGMRQATTNASH